MSPGDNPPVAILLCIEKSQLLVRYALAGRSSQLFVSKYQLALPDEAEMPAFIEVIRRASGASCENSMR
ncbi:MAG: PDDEXK nuclease domain-containing protein [Acidobacteriota bacterium]